MARLPSPAVCRVAAMRRFGSGRVSVASKAWPPGLRNWLIRLRALFPDIVAEERRHCLALAPTHQIRK